MNREPVTVTQPVAVRPITVAVPHPVEAETAPVTVVAEDSNNNTSLVDRERTGEAAETTTSSQHSPAVREIHKNSWLKKMPCIDKWSGKFPKVLWVFVFCLFVLAENLVIHSQYALQFRTLVR